MKGRGFTLIELLAAMAILAVVAVMSVQALGGVFHQRSVLTRIDDSAAALIRTLALLRQDLAAAIPAPEPAEGMRAGMLTEPGAFAFHRGGLALLPGVEGGPMARVRWALAGGQLTRQVQRNDGTAPAQPLLDGVRAMTLAPLAAGAADPTLLAPGYEVVLETATWGSIRVVVAR